MPSGGSNDLQREFVGHGVAEVSDEMPCRSIMTKLSGHARLLVARFGDVPQNGAWYLNRMSQQPSYRSDIDGLRAVAVLSVLAYHYREPFPQFPLSGGFAGVDVFFVISGFLITQIIVREIEDGRFSILGFYDRRIRRILPALAAMLAAALAAGHLLLMPGDYQELAISAAASAFGGSSFIFLAHTGYFDQAADLMPLLHTWSLAVEEQFYLVWPLLLVGIFRVFPTRAAAGAVIAALLLIGFGASLLWFHRNPPAALYMAPSRAWELALGALLVFLPPLPHRRACLATVVGLAAVVAGFIGIDANHFNAAAALAPCLGAALVIWPRSSEAVWARWLGKLAPIGLISYSLYLWHWPVWVLYRVYINYARPAAAEALVLAAFSIGLATLSYRFIEQPFRKQRLTPRGNVSAGLAAASLLLSAALYVDRAQGLPARISSDAYAMRSRDVMWRWPCRENREARRP